MADAPESNKETFTPQAAQPTGYLAESHEKKPGMHGCGPLIFDFRKLAENRSEVFIRLDGETYRLQLTRNNKLILTK